ncbi:acyltransferase family protein [Pontibacter pudoricolor]|uniref:acyltransferase family protein n=1 Tax=Pontibacter pudoricolor TaxID=2694930 RepID=UPI0013917553|nr:acyltransferase [Pontibacter pudoricolor]
MKSRHQNNFDFLRLLFALFVIITHSYTLTGIHYNDGLYQLTNNQITFSRVGLYGFFTISGYLILQSLNNSNTISEYYIKRVLRIFPGLLVVLLVTSICFSVLSHRYSIIGYFTLTSEPYTYVLTNFLPFGPFQGTILDTIENNPYSAYINGSIWTLQYEFLFYIVLSSLFFIKEKKLLIKSLLTISFICLYVLRFHEIAFIYDLVFSPLGLERSTLGSASQQTDFGMTGFRPFAVIDFGLYFNAGALLSAFNFSSIRYMPIVASLASLVMIITIALNTYIEFEVFLFPIIILTIGLTNTKWIGGLNNKIGDLSYGVYIYGFLIQQVLMHFFLLDHLLLTILTIPIALIAGFISWNLIEKKAINLKTTIYQQTQAPTPIHA